MSRHLFFFLLLFLSSPVFAQENPLAIFDPLVGKTWVANGQWGDGSVFKQEIRFAYDLDKKIVQAYADGFVNEAKTEWGKRNHGIRQWDAQAKEIRFWEFDVFGGVTNGKVFSQDQNIYYQYEYGSGDQQSVVTDAWEKIDDGTYRFKVGSFENGEWKQVYLEASFHALPEFSGPRKDLDQILAKTASFSQTYMQGDHEALALFYTEKGKIMPGGKKIIEGREPIAAAWKQPEGAATLHHQVSPEAIHIEGDTAYDYGYYQGRSKNTKGEVSDWKGKYVIIWKKIDDDWLIEVDIWNRVN